MSPKSASQARDGRYQQLLEVEDFLNSWFLRDYHLLEQRPGACSQKMWTGTCGCIMAAWACFFRQHGMVKAWICMPSVQEIWKWTSSLLVDGRSLSRIFKGVHFDGFLSHSDRKATDSNGGLASTRQHQTAPAHTVIYTPAGVMVSI